MHRFTGTLLHFVAVGQANITILDVLLQSAATLCAYVDTVTDININKLNNLGLSLADGCRWWCSVSRPLAMMQRYSHLLPRAPAV